MRHLLTASYSWRVVEFRPEAVRDPGRESVRRYFRGRGTYSQARDCVLRSTSVAR